VAGAALRRPVRVAGRYWADLSTRISALLRVSSVRYALLGLVAVAVLIAAMTQMASVIVDQWSQQDVELRARLVFRSIHDRVVAGLAAKATGADLKPFFEQLVEDERLQALAFCDLDRGMLYATKDMPSSVHCPKPPLPKVDTFNVLHNQEPPIAVALFPLAAKEGEGSLLVVHDLSFSTGGRMRPNSIWPSRSSASPRAWDCWRPRSCSRC
jgi:trehalose 6-phosphate synthase